MERRGRAIRLAALACLAAMLASGSYYPDTARAEYPEKPISLMVGFDVGGTADLSTRALCAAAEKHLGQPIVVENRGGGGGIVAFSVLANAKPDGYTLASGTSSGIIRGPQIQKVPFKPLKSFTSIIGFCAPETAIVVKKDAPWNTLKEFVDYAKQNPGKIKYGTTGIASAQEQAILTIEKKDGIKWTHIPYKGSLQAITPLLGGHIDAASVSTEFIPYVQSGQLKLLATHGEKRMARYPDVPTMKELGYDFVNETIFSIHAPAGLPPETFKKLETAFAKATKNEEFKAVLAKLDLAPIYYNGKAYDEYLKSGWEKIGKVMKEAGIIKEAATEPY
jgi:tripartite-type tricarboxylate transporter receptor subunit TctC